MNSISVGDLIAQYLEHCDVKLVFGVISIHNMPILDAIHRRGKLRFVSSRGEAGACNMADAAARVTGGLGVCITSTGTGAGNAAGALIEALTAGTPMLHLTGQIESAYIDRDLGYIHEAPAQLAMLQAVGKGAFRIRNGETALATLQEAVRLATTAPCGPVSIEIPIDVQASLLENPTQLAHCPPWRAQAVQPNSHAIEQLARQLASAKRPILWVGGGARHASAAVARFAAMGWAVVSSVQGRGILPETHPMSLGSYNLQKPTEAFYRTADAMLVVGSRLRSNETLSYKLDLPTKRYRIDANQLAANRAYASEIFVHGDAQLSLNALAEYLENHSSHTQGIDATFAQDTLAARRASEALVQASLGPYAALQTAVQKVTCGDCLWVRDITLSNTMWGNRSPTLSNSRSGVHALGGGIGQGLAMGIGATLASKEHRLGRKVMVLSGDGGLVLNLGELACAVQEQAELVIVLMNDQRYGVIRNIQDAVYGGRHCYVDLHTPNFSQLCQSLGITHLALNQPDQANQVLQKAWNSSGR